MFNMYDTIYIIRLDQVLQEQVYYCSRKRRQYCFQLSFLSVNTITDDDKILQELFCVHDRGPTA